MRGDSKDNPSLEPKSSKFNLKLEWKAVLKKKYLILLVVSILVIGIDQITKTLITGKFRLGESVSVIRDFFDLTYVRNPGAAFGMLAQANPAFRIPFFICIPFIALLSIALIFRKISENDTKFAAALSLVVAGAIGNLVDRLNFGYVIDFLDFHWKHGYHFPVFNVADSSICIGVGLIMLDLVCSSKEKGSRLNVSRAH